MALTFDDDFFLLFYFYSVTFEIVTSEYIVITLVNCNKAYQTFEMSFLREKESALFESYT